MHARPDFVAPGNLEEALALKSELGEQARFIAGGTDLVLRLHEQQLQPQLLIDLRHLGLAGICETEDACIVGAGTPLSRLTANSDISDGYPALIEAIGQFAGPPIRNLATLGGNIVNSSPAADTVPALMAHDARVVLKSSGSEREMPLEAFFTGPGRNRMAPEEVLASVILPRSAPQQSSAFIKLGQRRSMAISVVNVATSLSLDSSGKIEGARIILGSVAPTPLRMKAAEAELIGHAASAETIAAAADCARRTVKPISDVRGSEDYRRRMVGVLVRRCLGSTLERLQS